MLHGSTIMSKLQLSRVGTFGFLKKKQSEELGHIRPILKGGSIETRSMAIARKRKEEISCGSADVRFA
jgi:hypothetical protein